MTAIHNDNSFKIALITEDLQGDQSKEAFAAVCEQAKRAMSAHEIGNDFRREYGRRLSDPDSLLSKVKTDMMDNYMIAAFVCIEMGFPKNLPVIAWASLNKMDFQGLHGEIACMRALMWAGFDVNAQSGGAGMTALHAMCNLQWGGGAHPRAVRHLIENGADVNIAIEQTGDTPMITLCGHTGWGDDLDHTFRMLFNAGADVEAKANDGSSARILLQMCQKENPHPLRAQLIADLAA